jgi:lycopene beta-cyclase
MSIPQLILVGGGLANALIALRLKEAQPDLNVLLVESGATLGGNHTWSFHGSDLTAAQLDWIRPYCDFNWSGYTVKFPELHRELPGSYHSITSESLHAKVSSRMADSILTNTTVTKLEPEAVLLSNGERMNGGAVIDGRGPRPNPHLDVRYQKFVGRVVRTAKPHGLSAPIIMDATSTQTDGYRFFYTLPFTANTLLIEDTRYSDSPDINAPEYGDAISNYAKQQNWEIAAVLREEDGVLPITLGGDIEKFWDSTPQPVARSGLSAALFHPATGYSLPIALSLADQLAQNSDWSSANVYRITRAASTQLWNKTGFYRILNRMLFLAADPHQRRLVLQRFYRLKAPLIGRFYAGQSTLLDKARILSGKPPVKLARAHQAVFRYQNDGHSGD